MTTTTTSPAERAELARAKAEQLRTDRDSALAELARQQHGAPWASGHVAAEEAVQRLDREWHIARVEAVAAEFKAKYGPRQTEPAPTTVDELATLEAAHAAAACDLLALPKGSDHDDDRTRLAAEVATLEARLEEHGRDKRRRQAAAAETARRDQATAADKAEAAKVAAEAELTKLAGERSKVARQIETHLSALAADVESWCRVTHRLRAAGRAAGRTLGSGDERALAAHVAGLLGGAGVRGMPHNAGTDHLRPWGDQEAELLGPLLPTVKAKR